MFYVVQSELILFGNALWWSVEPDSADNKNGELALKLRKSYTYEWKYALILPIVKISIGFGNLWDHLRYV